MPEASEAKRKFPRWLKVLLGVISLAILVAGIQLALYIKMMNDEVDAKAPLGHLGAGRTAIMMFREKHDRAPRSLDELVPEFLTKPLTLKLPDRPASTEAEMYGPGICLKAADPQSGTPELDPAKLRATGKWGYISDPGGPCDGTLFIDSTREEERTRPYYLY
jgi:hypothetical protein